MSCVTHILFLTKVTISLWNLPGSAAPKPRQQAGDIAQQLRLLQVLKTCFVQSQIWFSLVLHVLTEKMDTLTIFGYSRAHLLESLNTQFCCKTNKPTVCNSCGADMSRELSLDDCFTLMLHRSVAHGSTFVSFNVCMELEIPAAGRFSVAAVLSAVVILYLIVIVLFFFLSWQTL